MLNDWDILFDEKVDGEYTLSSSKEKSLKLRFKSKT